MKPTRLRKFHFGASGTELLWMILGRICYQFDFLAVSGCLFSTMIIVDLISQRDAVTQQTADMDDAQKLAWLRQRGEVIPIPRSDPSFPQAYVFESREGLEAKFLFSDCEMIFLGDHTTFT
jgi:hypothetical protein